MQPRPGLFHLQSSTSTLKIAFYFSPLILWPIQSYKPCYPAAFRQNEVPLSADCNRLSSLLWVFNTQKNENPLCAKGLSCFQLSRKPAPFLAQTSRMVSLARLSKEVVTVSRSRLGKCDQRLPHHIYSLSCTALLPPPKIYLRI